MNGVSVLQCRYNIWLDKRQSFCEVFRLNFNLARINFRANLLLSNICTVFTHLVNVEGKLKPMTFYKIVLDSHSNANKDKVKNKGKGLLLTYFGPKVGW